MSRLAATGCNGRIAVDATLGILAGGRASRLGGADKAWMRLHGVPQVLRLRDALLHGTSSVLISANRNRARYEGAGLRVVHDRHPDIGPLGGLDALVQATPTPWLFTVPVDLVDARGDLLMRLVEAGAQGAWIEDDAGAQPLVALWDVAALRTALCDAIASGQWAVHALQRRLGMRAVRLPGVRLGNLNTREDLQAAGVEAE